MEKSNRENVSQARNAEIELDSQIAAQIRRIFLANAPERKGGLKRQIRVEVEGNILRVISDIYYMPYTEEKWISKQWRGRENPNEAWFRKSVEQSIDFLSRIYGKEWKRES